MRLLRSKSLIIIIFIVSLSSCIQDKPRILIIGDSVSIGYTPFVKENLANKADVFHNLGNAQQTGTGLEKIDEWIGNEKWDLCYRHPNSKIYGNRDKKNGKITYAIDEYASNLNSINLSD